jgi:LmbE family N-acetylglucosaminyl deacetylase
MRATTNHQISYLRHYLETLGPEKLDSKALDCFKFPDLMAIEGEAENRVLVMSPHEDDDILGCGGTLKLLRDAGAEVKVVYMTDGCLGSNTISPLELPAIRKEEAIRALKRIGVIDYDFFDASDLCLRCDARSIGFVKGMIDSFKPKMIMTPHAGEVHPDHFNTCMITAQALELVSEPIDVYAYEVWNNNDPNALVDITSVIEDKLSSMREHHSQMDMMDYDEKIRGLNVYRSINNLRSSKYSEAFLRFSREGFIKYARFHNDGAHNFDMMALMK